MSVPVEPDAPSVADVFPPAHCQAVWQYDNPGGYVVPTLIHPKRGYWVLASAPLSLDVAGTRPGDRSVGLSVGWNLIGIVAATPGGTEPVPPTPPCDAIWEYNNPGGYAVPLVCQEKKGFWVLATEAATLGSEGALPGAVVGRSVEEPGPQGPPSLVEELSLLVIPPTGPAPLDIQALALGVPRGARPAWTFGDGTTGAGNPVTHTYFSPGTYRVVLTVAGQELSAPVLVEPWRDD